MYVCIYECMYVFSICIFVYIILPDVSFDVASLFWGGFGLSLALLLRGLLRLTFVVCLEVSTPAC
jgi:hypothetical protein